MWRPAVQSPPAPEHVISQACGCWGRSRTRSRKGQQDWHLTSWHKWIVVNSVSLWRPSLIREIILPLTLHTLQLDCAFLFRNKIVTSVKRCNLENSSLLKRLGLSFKKVFSENLFISSHCNLAFPDSPPSLLTHYLSFLVCATFGTLIKPASVLF